MTVTFGNMYNITEKLKSYGNMMVTCDISVCEVNYCLMESAYDFLVCG